MYYKYNISGPIRVPPKELKGNMKKIILGIAQKEYEGIMDEDMGIVVAVTDIKNSGQGKIIPGDGGVYYTSDFDAIIYKPEINELVKGAVSEVTEFGAFVKTGPLEGLIHVSQIMDDFINYDPKVPNFTGKETGKKLGINDEIKARIVTVSLKGNIANSKIGLTMRQEGLGKEGWKQTDEKQKKRKEKDEKPKDKKDKVEKQKGDNK
ncbi:MAG: DNA-directed RNA polymerase [Candidatus Diapherotrites archaeon]|nr:DNA-directed RNA polymerase [Candidatus Diapherotrites archaeon]